MDARTPSSASAPQRLRLPTPAEELKEYQEMNHCGCGLMGWLASS
jgi:hypothetical protein